MLNIDFHVHAFFPQNNLTNVVNAMDAKDLNCIGLELLDSSVYPLVLDQARQYYPESYADEAGVFLGSDKCVFNAREYNTREGFHLITVGYSYDAAEPSTKIREIIEKGLENNAVVLLDHIFVDNHRTRTAGHITLEQEEELENICREYAGEIALEWNAYCVPWIRHVLQHTLNTARFVFGNIPHVSYHDVNKRAMELSDELAQEGFNLPVVADTDLHGRTVRLLGTMGTGRIITDAEGETPSDLLESISDNIFRQDYTNVMQYVSFAHMMEAFCIPILASKILPKLFPNPRS